MSWCPRVSCCVFDLSTYQRCGGEQGISAGAFLDSYVLLTPVYLTLSQHPSPTITIPTTLKSTPLPQPPGRGVHISYTSRSNSLSSRWSDSPLWKSLPYIRPLHFKPTVTFFFSWSWCGYRKHSALKTFPHVTLILARCFDAHSWWFPAFFLFATSYLKFFYFKKLSTQMVSLLFVQRK